MNDLDAYGDGYMEPEEEWEREGLLDPAWEKQQKKVSPAGPRLRFINSAPRTPPLALRARGGSGGRPLDFRTSNRAADTRKYARSLILEPRAGPIFCAGPERRGYFSTRRKK